jgi:Mn-dependent DtxR family transcriptional regulator
MIGGGNRRWTAALLRDYAPIKDLAELTSVLGDLVALGLVDKVSNGLYALTDAGRRELGREYGY